MKHIVPLTEKVSYHIPDVGKMARDLSIVYDEIYPSLLCIMKFIFLVPLSTTHEGCSIHEP